MPVPQRNLFLDRDSVITPAGAGLFVAIAVVTVFHDKVDSRSAVAVVVVIALPHSPERVDSGFPVVAEVVCEHLEV